MHINTDSQLKFLLLDLHERAHQDVAPHLMDALHMMGDRSPYKGGRKLVELLEFIEREALATQDAIGYATGRISGDDIVEKYDLYGGSGQDTALRQIDRLASAMHGLAAREVAAYLAEHPDATTAQVLAHLKDQSTLALRFVRAKRAGHYGAFRIKSDGSAWAIDVLADRTDFLPTAPIPAETEHLIAAAQIKARLARLDEIERVVEISSQRNDISSGSSKSRPGCLGASTSTPQASAGEPQATKSTSR